MLSLVYTGENVPEANSRVSLFLVHASVFYLPGWLYRCPMLASETPFYNLAQISVWQISTPLKV